MTTNAVQLKTVSPAEKSFKQAYPEPTQAPVAETGQEAAAFVEALVFSLASPLILFSVVPACNPVDDNDDESPACGSIDQEPAEETFDVDKICQQLAGDKEVYLTTVKKPYITDWDLIDSPITGQKKFEVEIHFLGCNVSAENGVDYRLSSNPFNASQWFPSLPQLPCVPGFLNAVTDTVTGQLANDNNDPSVRLEPVSVTGYTMRDARLPSAVKLAAGVKVDYSAAPPAVKAFCFTGSDDPDQIRIHIGPEFSSPACASGKNHQYAVWKGAFRVDLSDQQSNGIYLFNPDSWRY